MATARTMQSTKPAGGLVIVVQPPSNGADPRIYPRQHAGWIDVLTAGAEGHEVELVVGQTEHPPRIARGEPVIILCAGIIRCRVACAGVNHSVFGYTIVLAGPDIVAASRITVPRDVLSVRWEEAFDKQPPVPLTFRGARAAWWAETDEQPLRDWAGACLPPDLAESARGLTRLFGSVPAPATTPPAAPAAPATPERAATLIGAPALAPEAPAAPTPAKRPRAAKPVPAAAPAPAPVTPTPGAPAPVLPPTTQRSLF